MAKLNKKQLAWRPGQTKVRRSSRVMFASTILVLEALVVIFAGLAIFGLRGRVEGGALPLLIAFGVLALVFILACAVVNKPWGISLGWGLQVLLILMGILEPMMFIVGIAFGLTWAYAMVKGGQMDRDNAERAREQAAWEAANPE
ncbi:DUF4233 domain-containing protein [Galactobacter valiniphilus]|uniref:DUF4233 domain-containing protein n=1 Tax=Galactobacter valiniphilus TaxID=2676122 RepID=A0A399J7Z7_9MICC|nr:DUF4233 domain-containing protein [Galactobacter valiniphilus]RII41240.1 DUF4233 domain-containing protein [Galactobacter valiniphilus]